jgi:hypothetical protein
VLMRCRPTLCSVVFVMARSAGTTTKVSDGCSKVHVTCYEHATVSSCATAPNNHVSCCRFGHASAEPTTEARAGVVDA